jgi:hypothetical protein
LSVTVTSPPNRYHSPELTGPAADLSAILPEAL